MKKFIAEYLTFTRKERIAVFLLLFALLFVFFLPSFSNFLTPKKQIETDTSWISEMKQLEEYDSSQLTKNNYSQDESADNYQFEPSVAAGEKRLFYFDPNTISKQQWEQLGIPGKTANTIQNYLAKGGKFKTPEDLKRIYGLKQQDYERLLPYVKIEKEVNEKSQSNHSQNDEKIPDYNKPGSNTKININDADTSALIRLNGIGSKLAARIVLFRDKLGGFYTIEQIREIYGLPDSVFQKIKPQLQIGDKPVKKININTAAFDELKMHPYIKSDLAKIIIAYRNEHGKYSNAGDLKKIPAFTNEILSHLLPYIVTD